MIKIIRAPISDSELREFLGKPYREMIKFVVDIRREVIALGGEMHADAQKVLLEDGSKQQDVWGANIYPGRSKEQRLEWHSLINIRPSVGNCSIEIQDRPIQERVRKISEKLLACP